MRKVVIAVMTMAIMVACLAGCSNEDWSLGNENWGLGNYSFTHVHVSDGLDGYCATIKSWHDNDRGVELHTEEFGNVYLSEGTYALFEHGENCPFCNAGE